MSGALGNTGSAVVAALLRRGVPVRALVRPGGAAMVPEGCEVAEADLRDIGAVVAAAKDVAGVFALAGYPGIDDGLSQIAYLGVQRVVLMSNLGAVRGDLTNAVDAFHIRSEQAVASSGMAWTVIRSYALMSNVFRWTDQLAAGDRVRLPFAEVPIAMVDPADVGEVAAICLTESGHQGAAYSVSGGRAWTPAEQVEAVGHALGRDLRFDPVPASVARVELAATTPAPYVDAFFRYYEAGEIDETTVVDTVERLTGHPAGSLPDYLRRPAVAARLAPLRPGSADREHPGR